MVKRVLALVAILGVTTAATQPQVSTPLQPIGKWNVEYNPAMCVLSHAYGSSEPGVTLGFRPWPLGDRVELVLLAPDKAGPPRRGTASVTLGGIDTTNQGDYISWTIAKTGQRISTITIDRDATARLVDAKSISIAFGKAAPTAVTLPVMKSALAALKTCNDDLIRSWGIDPLEQNLVATPASGSPAAWISTDDYPSEALRDGIQGEVTILWKIDTDGRAKECKVIGSSGNAALDAASCRAIMLRAHYTAAKGQDGKPVATHGTRHILWRLPG